MPWNIYEALKPQILKRIDSIIVKYISNKL